MPETGSRRGLARIVIYGGDILRSCRFRGTRKNMQHGSVSVYEHTICAAGCSLEIIRKHMWPFTIAPPTCREAWIVTAADKYCSLPEMLRLRKGKLCPRRKEKRKKGTEAYE